MIRRRRSSTVNRTNSDLRILRGIESRGRRVATQARPIGKLIRIRPHIRPAACRASSVYILAVIGSCLVLILRKRAAPPSEARLAAVAVGRRRSQTTRQHTTFGVRARREAQHQRNREHHLRAMPQATARHVRGVVRRPRIECREWPDRRDLLAPRGRSAREGAPSRDRADHASRARVKNAALERDARRVGALELDRARRAGLCVTRGARPSWL